MSKQLLSYDAIIEKGIELGWDDVGITSAEIPQEDRAAYEDWIKRGYQGELGYMEKSMRCWPKKLLPEAKSIIIFISNYKKETRPFLENKGLVASYARGRDYHNVHWRRCRRFIRWLEEVSGEKDIARGFSDSKPIMERALAAKAGLGWFGKNNMLIHRKFGTFTLLSGVITTLDLPTAPLPKIHFPRCGTCTLCLEACPVSALTEPYKLDAAKCLSYHLIESKTTPPKSIQKDNPGYGFGCDICQDVCPHNVRSPLSTADEWQESSGIGAYLDEDTLQEINKDPERLHGTALKRRGYQGLLENLYSLNSDSSTDEPDL